MSWRLLLPALLLTARHTATTHSNPIPTNNNPTPTTLSPLANNPSTNPCASSYYYHPPPPPSTSYHWSNSPTLLTTLLRTTILTLVHGFCALHLRLATTLHTHNLPALQQLVLSRPPGHALLTVSNHTSTLDDPYVITALLPFTELLSPRLRHSWCAADICFRREWYVPFFRLGRIFPVQRGGGLYQTGMTEALSYLVEGGWMHVSHTHTTLSSA